MWRKLFGKGTATPSTHQLVDDATAKQDRTAVADVTVAVGDAPAAAAPATSAPLPSGQWQPGDRVLGAYVVERLLGAGGFGEVYLVRMQAADGAPTVPFALKRMKARWDISPEDFRDELRSWAELPQHPNLLPYKFFRLVGDELLIASEYVAGGSWADHLARGIVSERTLDIAIQAAWGLAEVHKHRLIHQDIKPQNVLIAEGDIVKISDFGLACEVARSYDRHLPEGHAPVRGSTPAYASPEQARGEPVTAATDVWSLAASMLTMHFGKVPWQNWQEVVTALPVLREMADHDGEGDFFELVNIAERCLQVDPARRPSSSEVADALIEAYERVNYAPYPRARPETATPAEFHAGSLSHEWYEARRLANEASQEVLDEMEKADEAGDRRRWDALYKVMTILPRDMTAIGAGAGRSQAAQDVRILEMLDGTCATYRGLIALGRADLRHHYYGAVQELAEFHRRRGDFDAANAALAAFQAYQRADPTAVEDPLRALVARFETMRHQAIGLEESGKPQEALQLLVAAINELWPQLEGVAPAEGPASWVHNLLFSLFAEAGICAHGIGNFELSEQLFNHGFNHAAELSRKHPGVDPISERSRGWALSMRANTRDRLGRSEQAVSDYREAIDLLESLALDDMEAAGHHETAVLNLGVTLWHMGRAEDSLPHLNWVVAKRKLAVSAADDDEARGMRGRSQAGDWQPRHRLAFARLALCRSLADVGRRDEAREVIGAALQEWTRLVEEGHAHLARYPAAAAAELAKL